MEVIIKFRLLINTIHRDGPTTHSRQFGLLEGFLEYLTYLF